MIAGLVLLLSMVGRSHAQSVAGSECSIVDALTDRQGVIRESALLSDISVPESLYPADAIFLAVQHLQAACCAQRRTTSCPSELPEHFASSTMLYEQLVGIGLKRMDGDSTKIYDRPDLVDTVAEDRRTFINQQGTNPNGTPPGYIINHFSQIVEPTANDKINVSQPIRAGDADDIQCGELREYESLIMRIQQQCAIAYCVTKGVYSRASLAGDDTARQGLQVPYHDCLDVQQQRILSEYDTTNNIIKEQATHFLLRNMRTYLQSYMIDTRMSTIAEKIAKQVSLLEIINSKYTEGTKMCN